MQQAKDTFLVTLRDRLAVVNPARVVTVRGAQRPAVLAVENELREMDDPAECFVLHWLTATRDTSEPLPLHSMSCEIRYAALGVPEFSGMDRGRVLAAMDVELGRMLEPRFAGLVDYGTVPPAAGQTRVFWSEREPAVITEQGDRLHASSKITVFALEEAGG